MKKIKAFYKKHKVLIIAASITILIIATLISLRADDVRPGINTWNNITIGQPISTQDLKSLNPISIEQEGDNTSYKYKSKFRAFPNEVVVTPNQTTEFIKEYIVANESHTIGEYIVELGQYDLEFFVPEIGDTVTAGVFLNDGLVVVFQNTNKKVVQKWFFPPTNSETFINTWGQELTTEPSGPEEHILDI